MKTLETPLSTVELPDLIFRQDATSSLALAQESGSCVVDGIQSRQMANQLIDDLQWVAGTCYDMRTHIIGPHTNVSEAEAAREKIAEMENFAASNTFNRGVIIAKDLGRLVGSAGENMSDSQSRIGQSLIRLMQNSRNTHVIGINSSSNKSDVSPRAEVLGTFRTSRTFSAQVAVETAFDMLEQKQDVDHTLLYTDTDVQTIMQEHSEKGYVPFQVVADLMTKLAVPEPEDLSVESKPKIFV